MKFLVLILLFPVLAQAHLRDTVPSGVPQLFGGKYYKYNGYILVDSFIMTAAGDTLDFPRYPALKFRALDNRWYGHDRGRWQSFLWSSDTSNLLATKYELSQFVSGINQLSGDVIAGPGSGLQAATISNNAVTNQKFRQSAALSIVGNSTNATTNVADISASSDNQVLRRLGANLGFGALNLASANAVSGVLSNNNLDTPGLKNIYLPLFLSSNKIINQAGNNIYFTGGGEVKADSFKITRSASFGSPANILGVGDSYMAGFRPCTPDTIFFDRLKSAYNLPGSNYGVSATGIYRADSIHNYRVNPGHSNISFVWAGFNDIRRGGITNDTTYRKVITGLKAIIANQFLKSWVAGGTTGVGVTRYGTWTTTYTCASVGGKSPNNGAYTNTNNDSIVYVFPSPDTSVVIATINGDNHTAGFNMGTFDIYVDGALLGHYSGLNADGISDGFYDNARTPNAFIITGLTNSTHRVKLVNTSSNYLVVDYFGHLLDASLGTPLLIAHAPYNNLAGFAVSPNKGSVAAMDKLNNQIDSMVAFTAAGWPIFVVPTNDYLDTLTGLCTDNIHPNNAGDIQITNAVLSVLSTPNTSITNGTLAFTGSYFKGAENGNTHLIPWLDQTLQKSDTSLFVSNQTSTDKDQGFRITRASTIKNKLTVGSGSLADGSDQMEILTTAGHMRMLGFSSQHYLQSVDLTNTTGVPFNFGAGTVNFGQISGGSTTNYATFDNTAVNKFTLTGKARIDSVRIGNSVNPKDATITLGTLTGTKAYLSFKQPGTLPLDQKIWDFVVETDSTLSFRTVDDAAGIPDSIFYVVRTGIKPLRFIMPHATLNVGYVNMQGNGIGAYFNRIIGANKDSVIYRSTTATRQMLVLDTVTGRFERMDIGGGIVSINSQTGPGITIAGDQGNTVTQSSNTITVHSPYTLVYSDTSTTTIANTTTKTTILGNVIGSTNISGSTITAGTKFTQKGYGILSTKASAPGGLEFDFTISNFTLGINMAVPANLTDASYDYEYEVTPFATGVNQAMFYSGKITIFNNATGAVAFTQQFNGKDQMTTTSTLTCDVTAQWQTADASNAITSRGNTLEVKRLQ